MKIKHFLLPILALSALTVLAACSQSSSQKSVSLNESAAASLQPALTEIYKDYHAAHPNVTIHFDFAGSGAIREKVLAGAPIDGVFLASKSDSDKLVAAKKAIDPKVLLSNTLVLISNKKNTAANASNLSSYLKSVNKIALGEPSTVPAGKYAEETLTTLKLESTLQPRFVYGTDVTQVLSFVAAGNADAGFVYKTDAMTNDKVKVLASIPASDHTPILYYTDIVKDSSHQSDIKAFNTYLATSAAQKIFEKYGFGVK